MVVCSQRREDALSEPINDSSRNWHLIKEAPTTPASRGKLKSALAETSAIDKTCFR